MTANDASATILPPAFFRLSVTPGAQSRVALDDSDFDVDPDEEWPVQNMTMCEYLDDPQSHGVGYLLTVTVRSPSHVDRGEWIGRRATFEMGRDEDAIRRIHGVITEVQLDGASGFQLHIEPALAYARFERDSRVFQNMSVLDIVREVLAPIQKALGGALDTSRLGGNYARLDYCVQYDESLLAFVLRILSQEGITLLFDHSKDDEETLVLLDQNGGLPQLGYEPSETNQQRVSLRYNDSHTGDVPEECLSQVQERILERPTAWQAGAWDFQVPHSPEAKIHDRGHVGTQRVFNRGRLNEGRDGKTVSDPTMHWAELMKARDVARRWRLGADGNVTAMRAGAVFDLDAPQDMEERWVVTRVLHWGSSHDSAHDGHYGCRIECQPYSERIVPAERPRPRIHGYQTALVTGPEGAQVHTDQYQRIQVRMLWQGKGLDAQTSCWLRVVTGWAGRGESTMFIPRIGTEVLVGFIDGDPDRPICVGCLFNADSPPPYRLPDEQTRTVVARTNRLDGRGYHELSFDDGHNAAMFLRVDGIADQSITGHSQVRYGANQTVHVKGDAHHINAQDSTHEIRGALSVLVGTEEKPAHINVQAINGDVHVRASRTVTFTVGDSSLALTPDGIEIRSRSVLLVGFGGTQPTTLKLGPEGVDVSGQSVVMEGDAVRVLANAEVAVTGTTEVNVQGGLIRLN